MKRIHIIYVVCCLITLTLYAIGVYYGHDGMTDYLWLFALLLAIYSGIELYKLAPSFSYRFIVIIVIGVLACAFAYAVYDVMV